MTDRELLELAAKAAGYNASNRWNEERLRLNPPVIGLFIDGVSTNWNPLTDDGDALRLAVKLGLLVDVMSQRTYCVVSLTGDHAQEEEHNNCPYSATRRAIVLAAAEIGKGVA